jgi:methyl-accepting chemotaxis protein
MARSIVNHGSEILRYVVCAGLTFLAIKLVAGYLSEQNRSLDQISASLDEIQDEISVLRDEVDEIRNNLAVVVDEVDHHVVQVGQAIDVLANDATLSTMQSNSLVRLMNDHFADLL